MPRLNDPKNSVSEALLKEVLPVIAPLIKARDDARREAENNVSLRQQYKGEVVALEEAIRALNLRVDVALKQGQKTEKLLSEIREKTDRLELLKSWIADLEKAPPMGAIGTALWDAQQELNNRTSFVIRQKLGSVFEEQLISAYTEACRLQDGYRAAVAEFSREQGASTTETSIYIRTKDNYRSRFVLAL